MDQAYYAHPQNQFWGVMHRGGVTPYRLTPRDYSKLPQYGVGLTDICKHAFGADSAMTRNDFDPEGLTDRIIAAAPGIMVFNGKFSAKHYLRRQQVSYGLLPETIGPTRLYVAPSTSPLARRYWDEVIWMDLLRLAGFAPLETGASAEP